jgi:hypothetical protein
MAADATVCPYIARLKHLPKKVCFRSVVIGEGTAIGPAVQILASDHPRDPRLRRQQVRFGRPVTIGSNVWIGGGAIVLPGITIGNDAIVGAGSIVTRDVAAQPFTAALPGRSECPQWVESGHSPNRLSRWAADHHGAFGEHTSEALLALDFAVSWSMLYWRAAVSAAPAPWSARLTGLSSVEAAPEPSS